MGLPNFLTQTLKVSRSGGVENGRKVQLGPVFELPNDSGNCPACIDMGAVFEKTADASQCGNVSCVSQGIAKGVERYRFDGSLVGDGDAEKRLKGNELRDDLLF